MKALHHISMQRCLFLPIQISKEIPAKRPGRIIEPQLLVHAVDLLHVFCIELKVTLQICLDPARRLGLGDDGPAMGNPPRQRHLRTALVVLHPNLVEHGILDQPADVLARIVDLVLVAKGRILGDVDVMFPVEGVEGVLGEVGVHFDLVDGGGDGGGLEESLELGFGEIGDADGFAFSGLDQLFHRFVGLMSGNQCLGRRIIGRGAYFNVVAVTHDGLAIFIFGKHAVASTEW